MTTIIHERTKKGRELYAKAMQYAGENVFDVYTHPSRAKVDAYNNCIRKMNDTNGNSFQICAFNTFMFSCSWMGEYKDADGVVYNAVYYETNKNSYIILL